MSFTISQNLYTNDSTVITVVKCSDDTVNMRHLLPLLNAIDHTLGVAATYNRHCQLSSIAFSTCSRVLVVDVPERHIPQPAQEAKRILVARGRALIQEHLLHGTKFHKYGFKMDQLAIALHLDLSMHINPAVDMLSVSNAGRHSLQALMNAMGGETRLRKENVQAVFFNTSKSSGDDATDVALQAWAACRAATLPDMLSRFRLLPRIDTSDFPKEHLDVLASIFRNAERLEALKPIAVKNDVEEQFTVKNDVVNLKCGRFPTRIKQSSNQIIRIEVKGKTATSRVIGRARKVDGKSVVVNVNGPIRGDQIVSVTTIGKDKPTCAEVSREDTILKTLQRTISILSSPFFQALWLPNEQPMWPKFQGQKGDISVQFPRPLNTSQLAAVDKMLSDDDDDRIVLIQGPPGTGKTTVIAASVISHFHANSTRSIWVAAQSNVAVKNIAEKFIKEGFGEFKLLVSKDFHHDWHEHLYEELERCLIRSDDFKESVVEASMQLCGCKVILCTLSMFSNPNADVYRRVLPVEMLILDEASQIECGNYLPIFHHFRPTLSKLVLIGDDKQLPPYGQEEIPELCSVFELPHLCSRALFLDTQYRMPHIIGHFISDNVYGGRLRTCHSPTTSQACRFIDVSNGQETQQGHSWTNREEARVVLRLARAYESKAMSFRIITPYDAQRTLIENYLRSDKLQWEDKVFNIDSFQGNEADHIIVSVVRSQRPGFLRSQRRTNVMLTRCKRSMVICSSHAFLSEEASSTLLGKLAASIKADNWVDGSD